jgi:hypothetical protein
LNEKGATTGAKLTGTIEFVGEMAAVDGLHHVQIRHLWATVKRRLGEIATAY